MGSLHADRASRGKEVLGAGDVARSLTRIAYEIVERNGGSDNLIIAGIPTRGATLARRLINRLRDVSAGNADLAIIDTTMFRDDLASQPLRAPKETLIPVTGIDGKTVVLVDDVLYTGRHNQSRTRRTHPDRSARSRPARRPDRPRPPRATDPTGLRRQEPADLAG